METEFKEFEKFGTMMLDHFGLVSQGWQFRVNSRKRAVGLCDYRKKTIYFSEHFIDSPADVVWDTILHEIAHVLSPPIRRYGPSGKKYWDQHGPEWQKVAKSIGCTGTRCAEGAVSERKWNYIVTCSTCGATFGRDRNRLDPKRHFCAKCPIPPRNPDGTRTPNLTIKRNSNA